MLILDKWTLKRTAGILLIEPMADVLVTVMWQPHVARAWTNLRGIIIFTKTIRHKLVATFISLNKNGTLCNVIY